MGNVIVSQSGHGWWYAQIERTPENKFVAKWGNGPTAYDEQGNPWYETADDNESAVFDTVEEAQNAVGNSIHTATGWRVPVI